MLSTKLFLREPEELEAFARFCTDMANVKRKQRAEKSDDCPAGPAEPLVRAFERARTDLATMPPAGTQVLMVNQSNPADNGVRTVGLRVAPTLPPPHDSLEEAQRAAERVPEGLHAVAPVGFDTQDAAKLFAQPVGATPPAVPLPPSSAPSTAAVGQFLTAPAAPPAGLPPASSLPVPPSAPSVAALTAAGTTSPAGVVDLDADGLPWDHRIHSSSKEKNKDGRWRAKRSLNDGGLVKRVEAELRATMAIPAPLPAVPSVPQIPAPPTAAATDPTDFASLIAVLTPRLTPDRMPKIFEIVQSFGLPGLPALQQRPDLVPAVWAKLKEHLG